MDKTTKILLALIAAGLWANIIAPTARAQPNPFTAMDPLASIARDINAVASGVCTNRSLCGR